MLFPYLEGRYPKFCYSFRELLEVQKPRSLCHSSSLLERPWPAGEIFTFCPFKEPWFLFFRLFLYHVSAMRFKKIGFKRNISRYL